MAEQNQPQAAPQVAPAPVVQGDELDKLLENGEANVVDEEAAPAVPARRAAVAGDEDEQAAMAALGKRRHWGAFVNAVKNALHNG